MRGQINAIVDEGRGKHCCCKSQTRKSQQTKRSAKLKMHIQTGPSQQPKTQKQLQAPAREAEKCLYPFTLKLFGCHFARLQHVAQIAAGVACLYQCDIFRGS